jgi:malonyl-CoA/methylmalonyl-CoA synthetase
VPVPAGHWGAAPSWDPDATLPTLWASRWRAHPDTVVLREGRGAPAADGATLERRTATMATLLVARGVRPGDRVLWRAGTTLASVECLLAILRAGAVLVPVSPAATNAELAHVAADAGPVAAITDDPGGFRAGEGPVVLGVDELDATLDARDAADVVPRRLGDDALIVYTSGTTGRPKGAVHTHASLRAGMAALVSAWSWTPHDDLVLCLPLFHVHGLCAGLFGTLAAGGSARLFERFDVDEILATAPSCTMFFGVPTMYHRLAASGRARRLAGLRLCVSGSAPLAADLWHSLASEGVTVLERYGMTETLLTLSNPLVGERRPGAVGVPLPAVEAAILEPDEHGVGELLVRGPSLCRGYWGRSEERTAEEFLATGDLASVSEDGYVTIRGRRTELIITGGHNVYPAEVEAVLSRHPGVVEVAVVGVASPEWGETVVAYVVGDPDLDSLRERAAAELAPFKRPREVRLVPSLPRNALGKVVRGELRER